MTLSITQQHSHSRSGFTLFEMTVVLTLIGLVIAGGLVTLTASVQRSQWDTTISRMQTIDKALLNFVTNQRRLPCPASFTIVANTTTDGVEAYSGSAGSGACASGYAASNGVSEGTIPVRTLELPDNYEYDGWGRRMRYSVDPHYTATNSFPTTQCGLCNTSPITIQDSSAGNTISSDAVYALVSHGANGHGAWTPNATLFIGSSTNTDELWNCRCSTNGTLEPSGSYTPNYIQKSPTPNSTTVSNSFDDIVTYKEPWQMQTSTTALQNTQNFMYWYVAGVGNTLTKSCLANPTQQLQSLAFATFTGIATDPYCNLWVTINTHTVGFDRNGTQFENVTTGILATGLAIDGNGNLWESVQSTHQVKELNKTGTVLLTIGTGLGIANGQFDTPLGVTVDHLGNIWVADSKNNRVQEFNKAGAWIATIPAAYNCSGIVPPACTQSSSANGLFNTPANIVADQANNILVTDAGNRVQKFDSNGNYIMTIPSSVCFTGNTACFTAWSGYTMIPGAMTVDNNNHLWVSNTNATNPTTIEFDGNGNWIANYAYSTAPIAGLAVSR